MNPAAALASQRVRRHVGRPPGSPDRNGRARWVNHRARTMSAWRSLCIAFGNRIRALREEQNIAADELGAAIGASKSTIWSWERGEAIPSVPTLLLAAAALDCSLVDLMPDEAHHRVEPTREGGPR